MTASGFALTHVEAGTGKGGGGEGVSECRTLEERVEARRGKRESQCLARLF